MIMFTGSGGAWDRWINSENRQPATSYWYPTLWVMPDNEGIMSRATYWSGSKWEGHPVDYWMNIGCDAEDDARRIACENGVEN
jgi:hypothetical protein